MFNLCKNSKKQGDVGLGSAIGYFTSIGYTVLIPLTDSQDYDLVIDNGERLQKVQVKTTYHKSSYGIYIVGVKMQGGNSKENYVHKFATDMIYDFLFILTEDGNKYLIPKEDIKDIKSRICLGYKYEKYRVK